MPDKRQQLQRWFVQQEQFSVSYSPLYAALFGTVARWLAEEPPGTIAGWLVEAAADTDLFAATNLLAAALHRDVLAGEPPAAALRAYYPTAGGEQGAMTQDSGRLSTLPGFEEALAQAILPRRAELQTFLRTRTVQTNETGRGLAWLLPAAVAPWPRLHLLDLGASAGLNLVAELRRFELHDGDRRLLAALGQSPPADFEVQLTGWPSDLTADSLQLPAVASRTGGDLHPFRLNGPEDELTLSAFVWADQVARLERLRAAIAILKKVNRGDTAVQLHPLDLPEALPAFLAEHVRADNLPVICYNTYIRMYLPEKGAALRGHLQRWARRQTRPVLWVQWEPPSCLAGDYGPAPDFGWLAWTVDLWQAGRHHRWLLGWVHPHGQWVALTSEFEDWTAFWRTS